MNSKEFFYRFGKALYRIDTMYDEFAKKNNSTTSGELWIMYALSDGNEYSQKQISEDWEIPKTTVNYVIKDLEAKGIVELVPIKGTRREKAIRLTESGKEHANELLSGMQCKEEKVYKTISDPQMLLDELEDLAEKLRIIGEG